jgi:hypothetical protein
VNLEEQINIIKTATQYAKLYNLQIDLKTTISEFVRLHGNTISKIVSILRVSLDASAIYDAILDTFPPTYEDKDQSKIIDLYLDNFMIDILCTAIYDVDGIMNEKQVRANKTLLSARVKRAELLGINLMMEYNKRFDRTYHGVLASK